jgi:hypothetical protein
MCILGVNKRKISFFVFMILSCVVLFNLYSAQINCSYLFSKDILISNVKACDNSSNTSRFLPNFNSSIEADSSLESYLNSELYTVSDFDFRYTQVGSNFLPLKVHNSKNSDGESAFFIKRLLE